MLMIGPTCGVNASDSQAVLAFKKHLSTIPCFSKIVFSEADCQNNIIRSYYAAVCGLNYVYRTLDGKGDIDLPVSATNRNRSSIYVGRYGDMHWAIAGYDLTISIKPPADHLAPDGSCYVFVNEILTFGFQAVQAGTFVWRGNTFAAKPSQFARELGDTDNFTGEIHIEAGVVKKMIVHKDGMSEFSYATNGADVPHGLPLVVTRLAPDGSCRGRWIIHSMIPANREASDVHFDPYQRIQSDIAMVRVISNGVEYITHAQDQQLRNKVLTEQLADFAHLKKPMLAKQTFVQKAFLVVLVLLLGLGGWYFWRQGRQN